MPSVSRISITLTIAMLLVGIGGAAYMAVAQTTERAAAFAREGRIVEGRVKDGYAVQTNNVMTYELSATFLDENGAPHKCYSATVSKAIAERAVRRGKVQITYLPSQPSTCYFENDRPRPENNYIFGWMMYLAWGGAVLAIGSLFINFGGGDRAPLPQDAPARASGAARGGFGRRQR